ncbi:MAG: hypothetical protein LWW85_09560, partial [Marinilabiliales bacterium]|nr:hypothetical protein [Marinilabiliales bacterium]
MRSTLCCLLICLTFFCVVSGTAYNPWENPNRFKVVFYNVENFFDTVDDPTTNDGEYTPKGKNHWTVNHMKEKAGRIYKALISAAGGTFPDIIGFAEIENLDVLEFLLKNTPLGEIGYGIVHKESPDPRGIDVALLYKKNRVMPVSFHFIAVGPTAAKPFNSRDILQFDCRIAGERVCFFVNHWPSRAGGYMQTTGKRNYAAGLLRHRLDSLFNHDKSCRILLMGDFNATPDEDCLASILQASMDRKGKPVN